MATKTITGIKAGQTTITASYTDGGVTKTSQVTFTVNKIDASLSFAAVSGTLTYNHSAQKIGTISYTGDGTVYYLVKGNNSEPSASDSGWVQITSWTTTSGATKTFDVNETNAGTYYVFLKADTGTNYNSVPVKSGTSSKTIDKVSDASVTVTLGSAGTYHNAATLVAANGVTTHGTATAYVGYKYGSAATSDDQITWVAVGTALSLSATASPGTYYIYKKWTADSNHSNDQTYTPVGTTYTLTRSQASDASVTVTLASNAGTYHNAATLVAANGVTTHGTSAAYVGYKLGSAATADSQITWVAAGTALTLDASAAAGTYYIYKKWTADSNHSNSQSYTQVGTTYTLTRSQASDASVSVTLGSAGTYDSGATLVSASNSSSHGTSEAKIGYKYGSAATADSQITWVNVGTALTLSATADAGTYYIYKKWTADSNHSNSADYTLVDTLDRSQNNDASVTVTLGSAGTYDSTATLVAAGGATTHGTSAAYVGYKYGSVATADSQITWVVAGTALTLGATAAAGTYYIYKKWTADGNHSNSQSYTQVGTTYTLERSKNNDASVTVTLGSAGTYHNAATLVAAGGATAHGTSAAYVGYKYGSAATSDDQITWVAVGTALSLSATAAPGTYYIYKKWTADSNHSNNQTYTPVGTTYTLTRSQASDASVTVTLASNAGTYETAATLVSAANSTSHGTSEAKIGYKYDSAATADSQITWVNVGTALTLSATADAGTYYIYKKWTADSNHSNSADYTQVGTLERTAPTGRVTISDAAPKYHSGNVLANVSGATGIVHYRLGTSGSFSTDIPTATSDRNVGTYTLQYYVDPSSDGNYAEFGNSSSPKSLSVSISQNNDASVTVTLASNAGTYETAATLVAAANSSSHGTSAASIGYKYGSAATADSQITWVAVGTALSLTASAAAGTYYIYKKWTADSNHSNSADYTLVNTLTRSQNNDASVSVTLGSADTYGNTATLVAADKASSHGTSAAYVGYKYGSAATADNQITWVSVGTALSLAAGADAGTYYIYKKWTADSNHSNSANYTLVNTLTRSQAIPTFTLTSSGDVKYDNTASVTATVSVPGTVYWGTTSATSGMTTELSFASAGTKTVTSRTSLGTTTVHAYFVPTDTTNYASLGSSSSEHTSGTAVIVKNNDASVTPTINANTLTYSPSSALTLITGTSAHGTSSYQLGYKLGSAATADSQITWGTANATTLTIPAGSAAGTYYLYKKWTADGNHSNDQTYTAIGSTYTKAVNKAQATLPSTISGDSKEYHETARATVSKDAVGGTLKYSTDSGSNWSNVTWSSGNLTANPSRTAVGDTSVIFKVFNTDGNYSDSSTSEPITISVYASDDARMEVTIVSTELTYSGSNQTIASVNTSDSSKYEGIQTYYIGYKSGSTATADSQITWNNANTTPIQVKNAGTYYIYYKFTSDASHSNDKEFTLVGSKEIKRATGNISYSVNASVSKYCTDAAMASSACDGNKSVTIATSGASTTTNTGGAITYAVSPSTYGITVASDGLTLNVASGTSASDYSITVRATVASTANYDSVYVDQPITVAITAVELSNLTMNLDTSTVAYGASASVTSLIARYTNNASKDIVESLTSASDGNPRIYAADTTIATITT